MKSPIICFITHRSVTIRGFIIKDEYLRIMLTVPDLVHQLYLKLPLSGHVSLSTCGPFMRYRDSENSVYLHHHHSLQ